jgi:hypothetical protein
MGIPWKKDKRPAPQGERRAFGQLKQSGFGFGLQHFAATVKTVGADVVAQMGFTSGGFYGNARNIKGIVRAVHTALGRRFFILLDSHDGSWTVRFEKGAGTQQTVGASASP